jgi:molecular chaperone Hsp33
MSDHSVSDKSETKKSRVHRFVTNDFSVRVAAVDATSVVREMQNLQNTSPLPTVGVGRAMVGAILMSSNLKPGQEVGIYIKGDGPMGSIYAEASYEGKVRGYTPHTFFEPANYDKGLSLKDSIGKGVITVVRNQPFQRQPHQGTVELVSGEIGEDIASYLHQSQQIRSVTSLGVYLDTFGKVRAAGGFTIEIMPGVEESIVDTIQANFSNQKNQISQLILDGLKPEEFIAPYLKGLPFTEIPHEPFLEYFCPCDHERIARALEIFPLADLDDMIQKGENTEITCQMCGKVYNLGIPEIQTIRNEVYKKSLI